MVNKYTELLLYIISTVGDRNLGKTKLYKILFFVDFEAIKVLGRKITNDKYLKYPMGPVPEKAWTIITVLESTNDLKVKREISNGKFMYLFNALRGPDISVFTSEELELIKRVVDGCAPKSKTQLVIESHGEPWSRTENWKEIVLTADEVKSKDGIKQTGDIVKDITSQYSVDIETLAKE